MATKKKAPKVRNGIAWIAKNRTGGGSHRDRKRERKQKGFEDDLKE
jgi:hypothetical protein